MVHGNRFDKKKKIMVSCHEDENSIQFFISDEGSGFDPQNIPDPTSETCIELEGGRGVFLMKQLTHELQFLDQGRTVQLKWKI